MYTHRQALSCVYVLVVLVILILSGCGTRQTCPACTETVSSVADSEEKACVQSQDASGVTLRAEQILPNMKKRIEETFRAPTDSVETLLLSGGGSYGAWGAGVLYKLWQEDYPTFEIVTGVSTGALMATYAFLGKEVHMNALRDFYTNTENEDILQKRLFFVIPFSNSLYSTAALRSLINEQLTDELIRDEVAPEGRKNRLLFVGTVNLDTGDFCVWNLTQLALNGKYDTYRNAVLASAMAPPVFPPVQISDELHVDGGVRLQVFGSRFARESLFDVYEQKIRPQRTTARPIAYVIINNQLVVDYDCTNNYIIDVGLRSVSLLTKESLLGNLYRIESEYNIQRRGPKGIWEFKASWIPDNRCLEFSSYEFDSAQMTQLFNEGVQFVQDDMWEDTLTPELQSGSADCGC